MPATRKTRCAGIKNASDDPLRPLRRAKYYPKTPRRLTAAPAARVRCPSSTAPTPVHDDLCGQYGTRSLYMLAQSWWWRVEGKRKRAPHPLFLSHHHQPSMPHHWFGGDGVKGKEERAPIPSSFSHHHPPPKKTAIRSGNAEQVMSEACPCICMNLALRYPQRHLKGAIWGTL